MKQRFIITSLTMALLIGAVGAVPAMASRSVSDIDVALDGCGCRKDAEVLESIRDEIAEAQNVEEARSRALAHTRGAQAALARARWVAPWSGDLRDAHRRLEEYEKKVRAAPDQEAVADEFATLVQLAEADPPEQWPGADGPATTVADVDVDLDDADVELDENGNDGCDYSTGDIIAIVIGFILGIIPGIILLFVLC